MIAALAYTYPEIKNGGGWIWKDTPFFSRLKNKNNDLRIISANKMDYPDLVLIRKKNSHSVTNSKKTIKKPKFLLNNILSQIEKLKY